MMRSALLIILFIASSAFAQSGRRKPTPTPTPKPIMGPSVVSGPDKGVILLPTPRGSISKKVETDSDDTIKVDSVLVPIPVSAVDSKGRAANTLKLTDFELKIDGKLADISELSRSESPIRLAMLFDNSS